MDNGVEFEIYMKKLISKVLKIFIKCRHEFNIKDIKLTHIPFNEMPIKESPYKDFEKYYEDIYTCNAATKRVMCKCNKCNNIYYAHCGLDLDGDLK